MPEFQPAKDIFLQALELASDEDRAKLLDEACANNLQLRCRVEALLAAHDDPESYLERPAARFDVTATTDGNARDSGLSDSSSSHHGRFLPGTRVADRYRIVSLLGRGGMGEVYRADDLRLGQTVALKFLPPELAKDTKRLEYFHNEVKLARQISHPNVCRVYDIGEVDGQHFISMEYIDGEDLKTLLHRIGRLPKDKGIQIAQQLCSGLSAAHAKGVLHRDLKPANIMIDGQGQARITDFGLATMSVDGENVVGMSGTPAYMAPEQLLRGQTNVQSDIYSLGLILFELTTGEHANVVSTLDELRKLHQESSSTSHVSNRLNDVDPALERVITRCLEPETNRRPSSLTEVLLALPGGDPIAAALSAGETPSPAIVAASGETVAIRPWIAFVWVVSIATGLVLIAILSKYNGLSEQFELRRAPNVLADDAQRILLHLGFDRTAADHAYGFKMESRWVGGARPGIGRWNLSPAFWYRESPQPLVANVMPYGGGVDGRVNFGSPAWVTPGMRGVKLNRLGQLRWFRAMPKIESYEATEMIIQPAWREWFPPEVLGFDLNKLDKSTRRMTTLDAADQTQAWEGTLPESGRHILVQAAAFRGQPTFFSVTNEPNSKSASDRNRILNEFYQFGQMLLGTTFVLGVVACPVLVLWNVRSRRGDFRGALRFAVAVFLLHVIGELLRTSHVADLQEMFLLFQALADSVFMAAMAWFGYLCAEPLIRRFAADTLISWSRLLRGEYTDPRVGRDILVGISLAVVGALVGGSGAALVDGNSINPWDAIGQLTADLPAFGGTVSAIAKYSSVVILFFAMLVVFKAATNSEKLAVGITVAYLTMVMMPNTIAAGYGLLIFMFGSVLTHTIGSLLGLRFGLLVWIVGFGLSRLLLWPITPVPSSYSFQSSVAVLLLILVLAIYGAIISTGSDRRRFINSDR